MNKEKLLSELATIEFVLFSVKNGDQLHAGEVENAHKKVYELMNVLYKSDITIK